MAIIERHARELVEQDLCQTSQHRAITYRRLVEVVPIDDAAVVAAPLELQS